MGEPPQCLHITISLRGGVTRLETICGPADNYRVNSLSGGDMEVLASGAPEILISLGSYHKKQGSDSAGIWDGLPQRKISYERNQ
ncbi:unnamed protein product [marine sediment metagenome]|uniref:Uncharacterized protein n=1 Tax=marine sediment metagenome TaxID=412755 RepID=X1UXK9_9ZZZZ